MSDFVLAVNGKEYTLWEEIRIHKTMNAIAGNMTLKTANFYSGKPSDWNIHMGDSFVAKYLDTPLCTGYIENILFDYDRNNYNVIFGGRDKTADLVDCCNSETENEWINESVVNIIRRLCSYFNITVKIDSTATSAANQKVDLFKTNESETVFESINRLCESFGIIPISKGDGYLYLTKASTSDYSYNAIDVGANVLKVNLKFSDVDRFSEYQIKGLGIEKSTKKLSDYIEPYGEASDSVVSRNRPTVLFLDVPGDSGKFEEKAKWEKNIRAGMSRLAVYKVYNWHQTNGNLWEINKLTQIKDNYRGIDDTFLISEIVYYYNKQQEGFSCNIVLVDKNTFSTNSNKIESEFDA